jgi:hypothetical protein
MDTLDNLIYTARNESNYPTPGGGVQKYLPLTSNIDNPTLDFNGVPVNAFPTPNPAITNFFYPDMARVSFAVFRDTNLIEDSMEKHWFDIANRLSYTNNPSNGIFLNGNFIGPVNLPAPINNVTVFNSFFNPPYHLIFSYLIENTRIVQIFEKLFAMILYDEKLTKVSSSIAARWLDNTEKLFFKSISNHKPRNIAGQLRTSDEATRRNAYYRMFGMDLAFGDAQTNTPSNYIKSDFFNSSFIVLFESFLREIWQAYTNARNTSGANTTDMQQIADIAQKLQELLMSRRTTQLTLNGYADQNLSYVEYSSTVLMSWLFFIISADTPVVSYLNSHANTPGERLLNIGRRVGLPAHNKSEAILDIAAPMGATLRSIELGDFNNDQWVNQIIRSQVTVPIPPPLQVQAGILNNLLIIINNWEKATGHRIKNPEANITGTVRVQPQQTNGVKPQPVMN